MTLDPDKLAALRRAAEWNSRRNGVHNCSSDCLLCSLAFLSSGVLALLDRLKFGETLRDEYRDDRDHWRQEAFAASAERDALRSDNERLRGLLRECVDELGHNGNPLGDDECAFCCATRKTHAPGCPWPAVVAETTK